MMLDFTDANALIDSFESLEDRMSAREELDRAICETQDGIIYCVALSLTKELDAT